MVLIIAGCQTTNAETVKEPDVIPQQKEALQPESGTINDTENPFKELPILPNQVVTSRKPVICGRIDIMLSRMEERFGELPVLIGKAAVTAPGNPGEKQVMSTLTFNSKTGSYTFLEQMPSEERLLCILSSGHGKVMGMQKGTAL